MTYNSVSNKVLILTGDISSVKKKKKNKIIARYQSHLSQYQNNHQKIFNFNKHCKRLSKCTIKYISIYAGKIFCK